MRVMSSVIYNPTRPMVKCVSNTTETLLTQKEKSIISSSDEEETKHSKPTVRPKIDLASLSAKYKSKDVPSAEQEKQDISSMLTSHPDIKGISSTSSLSVIKKCYFVGIENAKDNETREPLTKKKKSPLGSGVDFEEVESQEVETPSTEKSIDLTSLDLKASLKILLEECPSSERNSLYKEAQSFLASPYFGVALPEPPTREMILAECLRLGNPNNEETGTKVESLFVIIRAMNIGYSDFINGKNTVSQHKTMMAFYLQIEKMSLGTEEFAEETERNTQRNFNETRSVTRNFNVQKFNYDGKKRMESMNTKIKYLRCLTKKE